jgi:hypothetical protein
MVLSSCLELLLGTTQFYWRNTTAYPAPPQPLEDPPDETNVRPSPSFSTKPDYVVASLQQVSAKLPVSKALELTNCIQKKNQ